MKKNILLLVIGLVFGFANAQKIQYGVKAGLSAETLIGNIGGIRNFKSKLGYTLGGFAEYKFAEKFSLQPEVLYSWLGAKSDGTINLGGSKYDVKGVLDLSYLNIPIMVKYYVSDKFNLEFGPQFSFLLDVKSSVTYDGITYKITKESFETSDIGLNIGGGYDYTKHISLGARYSFGLKDIQKISDNESLKNSVASFTVGYKF